ncbi:unnamed protein product [Calypogeia fissa]
MTKGSSSHNFSDKSHTEESDNPDGRAGPSDHNSKDKGKAEESQNPDDNRKVKELQNQDGGAGPSDRSFADESHVESETHDQDGGGGPNDDSDIRELIGDDLFVPMRTITCIMKRAIPQWQTWNGEPFAKDAKKLIQSSVSMFICLITQEASARVKAEGRTILTAEDLLWAMEQLGFDDYVPLLRVYLLKAEGWLAARQYQGKDKDSDEKDSDDF